MKTVCFLFCCGVTFLVAMPVVAKDQHHQFARKNVAIYERPAVAQSLLFNQAVTEHKADTEKILQESLAQSMIPESLKKELITAFTADIALISRIITEGESNAQEREQFSGIFAKQLSWFTQVVEKAVDEEDAVYQSALAKKALIKRIVRYQEQADELLYARAKREKLSATLVKRARLLLLYELNGRMQDQAQKALTTEELEALVGKVCAELPDEQSVAAVGKNSENSLQKAQALAFEKFEKQQQDKDKLIKKMLADQERCNVQVIELIKKVAKNEQEIAAFQLQKEKMNEDRNQLLKKIAEAQTEADVIRAQDRKQSDEKIQELKRALDDAMQKKSEVVTQQKIELTAQQKEEKNKKELESLLLGLKK